MLVEEIASAAFCHLDLVDVRRAEHVRAEYDPLAVGRELTVRLQRIIVLCQIDELLGFEIPAANQFLRIAGAAGHRRDHVRPIKVNPLAVVRCGHAVRAAAVATKERLIR